MRLSSAGMPYQPQEEEKRCLNSELWHACAGPLVSLPALGSRAVYFPQGHSEQVTASTNKEIDAHIPNYPSLPPQLICQLHDVTMHADAETDEVYAQMTLQPLNPEEQKDTYFHTELGAPNKQPTNYFCKTLTASDTSTHGGFSVPRRAAEKVFPPLDFSQQPPAQELIARDLHENEWKFRHIFRGQPKRHLLTTGWSVFVSAKRLVAGDAVIFIWNENNQLLLGIRRANRPQTVMPSSVLSSDSMHIGLLAAAAHASATNSRFTIFYNPRASPCEFVIPVAKYAKAVYHTRVSIGMRFRMLFETEESSVRRYMGTITGISDLDPARWPNSHWRSVKVGWDESTAGERQPRVSLWDIEPLTTFPMYPSPFPLRLKRPWPPGLPSFSGLKDDVMGVYSPYGGEWGGQCMNYQGLGSTPWMQPSLLSMQSDMYQAMAVPAMQNIRGIDPLKKTSPGILQFQQLQNTSVRSASLQPNQLLQQLQSQPQQLFQNIQDSQNEGYLHLLSTLPQYHKPDTQSQQHQVLQQCQSQQQQKIQNPQHPPPPPQPQELQQRTLLPQQPPPQVPLQHQQLPIQHQQQLPQKEVQQQLPQNELQHQSIRQYSHQQNLLKHQHQQLPLQKQQHFSDQHMSSVVPPQKQQHFSDQHMTNVVPPLSQLTSSALQSISSFCQQQNLPDSDENHVTASHVSPLHGIFSSLSPEETVNLLSPQKSNSQFLSSGSWLPKRIGVDSLLSSGVPSSTPQMEQIGSPQTNASQHSVALPPFPGRDCTVNQDGSSDAQNRLLFGVNIDSSQFVGQSYIANLRNITREADSTAVPFAASNLLTATDMDLPLNAGILTSNCLEESRILQSSESVRQVDLENGAFVKVYKSGSFGRSLDITRFSSYPELRRELGRMFGLEGQLEDPLRSGWQLVFVDRENDILLVGDDPWQEFVNNVWCIKILSPREVQQMGKEGLDHLNSAPLNRLSSSSCDEYVSRQETRNMNTGITSVGSLDC